MFNLMSCMANMFFFCKKENILNQKTVIYSSKSHFKMIEACLLKMIQ